MSSQKMSQCFDLEDWIKCSGRSIRSGMMQNGRLYAQPMWEHPTIAKDSLLLPTPIEPEKFGDYEDDDEDE